MKVVLFCGGQGLRLREYSDSIPKPLVPVGTQPILWNVMRYYAHYGHKDFILCLGHQGEAIKQFFLGYNEAIANDFTMTEGGSAIELHSRDIQDWKITFVDTGLSSNIGQRLKAVQKHLEGEDVFLANYTDGLTNLPLDDYVSFAREQDKVACFVSVKPTTTFHVVESDTDGLVEAIEPISENARINSGYFVLKQEIFHHMEPDDELVVAPFHRLIEKKQLVSYKYNGFWECMDTFKDKQQLDEMHARGDMPWAVWK